jgi:hypothetical protein
MGNGYCSKEVVWDMSVGKKKKKTVIYTAIFGGKDELIEPSFVSPSCDYVCFTDQPRQSAIWKIVLREQNPAGDPVRSARRLKILPHLLFSEYEYSIWVDGNLEIIGNLEELIGKYLTGKDFATFDHANYKTHTGQNKLKRFIFSILAYHPFVRTCVYEEAEALIAMNEKGIYKDDERLIRAQMERYTQAGYPRQNSVLQSAVLVRRHLSPLLIKVMKDWWQEVKEGSRRDQLSFNFVAWKNKFDFAYIAGDPRRNKYVRKRPHKLR